MERSDLFSLIKGPGRLELVVVLLCVVVLFLALYGVRRELSADLALGVPMVVSVEILVASEELVGFKATYSSTLGSNFGVFGCDDRFSVVELSLFFEGDGWPAVGFWILVCWY